MAQRFPTCCEKSQECPRCSDLDGLSKTLNLRGRNDRGRHIGDDLPCDSYGILVVLLKHMVEDAKVAQMNNEPLQERWVFDPELLAKNEGGYEWWDECLIRLPTGLAGQ